MKYYSLQRPIGPGVLTAGARDAAKEVVNFDKRQYVDAVWCYAWGYIETDSKLSMNDMVESDLIQSRFDRLPEEVRTRLAECRSLKTDIPKIAACYLPANEPEEALILALELLDSNSQFFDLTEKEYDRTVQMLAQGRVVLK